LKDNYLGGKTLRTHALLLLSLLTLATCSSPAAATQIISSEIPAITAPLPTPTNEPTRTPKPTPKPSPTPDKYINLKPGTWDECLKNVVETDADFALLMKKVKENPIDPSKVPTFNTVWILYPPYNEKSEKTPQFVAVTSVDENGISFDACAAKKMPDGKILPLIVLPIKRPGSEIVDHIAVTFDFEAQNKWAMAKRQGMSNIDWSIIYNKLKNGMGRSMTPHVILAPGNMPETNEIWKVPLSLIPSDPIKAKEYYQNLYDYFDFTTSYPDETLNKARSFISSTILPVTFIDVGYYNIP
jgi:hypothetical protein